MEARPFLFLRRNHTVRNVFVDERFPAGELFIAPIQTQIHGKAHRTTEVMTGHRIVCEGIRIIAMVVMTIHVVEQTTHMLTQGVIEYQSGVGFRTADGLRLLEEILDPTVIDALL